MCGYDGGDGDGYDGDGFDYDGELGEGDFEMDAETDGEYDEDPGDSEYDPDLDVDAGIEADHEFEAAEYDPDIDIDAGIETSHETEESEPETEWEITESVDPEAVDSVNNYGHLDPDESTPEYEVSPGDNSDKVENIEFQTDDPDIEIRTDEKDYIDIYEPDEYEDANEEATVSFHEENVEDGPETENPGLNLGIDHELNEELTHEFETNKGLEIGMENKDNVSVDETQVLNKELSPEVQEDVYQADFADEKIAYREDIETRPILETKEHEEEPEEEAEQEEEPEHPPHYYWNAAH